MNTARIPVRLGKYRQHFFQNLRIGSCGRGIICVNPHIKKSPFLTTNHSNKNRRSGIFIFGKPKQTVFDTIVAQCAGEVNTGQFLFRKNTTEFNILD